MEPDIISKLPPALQVAAFIGAVLAGAVAWLLARRQPAPVPRYDQERLQQQLDNERLRAGIEQIMQANRESFFVAMREQRKELSQDIGELEDRLRDIEIELAEVRGRRPRGR